MSSEARLFSFSPETKTALRKFRLSTSRSNTPQAVIYQINKSTHEIHASDDGETYTSLQDIADELPDHTPRYVLLSHPITMSSGRLSVPYVMIYYLPVTCNNELKMMYAGAKELMKNTAECGKILEISDAEEMLEIEERLKSGE
ncbi:GMF family protein [Myriangium duriaei CBS 260.36]|uniref:GMF family protein n=1 Tax=Myriangium duriaei CBS 260.36 TaxID=1168546 RepID=A0A9P4MJT5_9PEZI|nr:GMF family protein [Myriangium duriaei CBS 260.36]